MAKPGRPPRDEARATARLSLRLTEARRLELRRLVDETGRRGGVAGLIREAVDEYCADLEDRRPFKRK